MRELKFLAAVWKANLLSAMEFRGPFITQIVMMMLNNAFYFVFWIIFFERFKNIRGWGLPDMLVLFGVTASAFGLGVVLFGNISSLSEIIANGRLDYYLSLPRPVLLHVLASRSAPSGLGDFIYGIISFSISGHFTWDRMGRFFVSILLASIVFVSFMTIIHSLTFWLGNAGGFAAVAWNAMLTFALYPISLFDNPAKLILFTLVPAALMGAVPVEIIRNFNWLVLGQLSLGTGFLLCLAIFIFYRGLHRYESGSAIQVEV